MKTKILTEDDFYQTSTGPVLRGGYRTMYNEELVVKVMRDGSYTVIKDRFGLTSSEVEREITNAQFDNNILLLM
jgi:hypothetical protein